MAKGAPSMAVPQRVGVRIVSFIYGTICVQGLGSELFGVKFMSFSMVFHTPRLARQVQACL